LNENSIDDDGAAILAESLKRNATLKDLGLRGNRIGSQGATALLNALKHHNRSLQSLDLTSNFSVSSSILSAINEFLRLNKAGIRKNFVRPLNDPFRLSLSKQQSTPAEMDPPVVRARETAPATVSLVTVGPTTANQQTPKIRAAGKSDDASDRLPKPRAELEFEIRRLTVIRNACMDTLDEEQWQASADAEQKIHEIEKEISSGNHPTGDELEAMVKELTISVREKVRTESVAAAMPLRERLLQLHQNLSREREAETRISEVERNGPAEVTPSQPLTPPDSQSHPPSGGMALYPSSGNESTSSSGKSRPPPPPYHPPKFSQAMEPSASSSGNVPPPPPPPPTPPPSHPHHSFETPSANAPAPPTQSPPPRPPPRPYRPPSSDGQIWGFGENEDVEVGLTFNVQLDGCEEEIQAGEEMEAGTDTAGGEVCEEEHMYEESAAEHMNEHEQECVEGQYASENFEESPHYEQQETEVINESPQPEYLCEGDEEYAEAGEPCGGDY
jgi:Leucine Rich repeat